MTIGHGGGYLGQWGFNELWLLMGFKGQDWVVLGCKKDHGLPFHSRFSSFPVFLFPCLGVFWASVDSLRSSLPSSGGTWPFLATIRHRPFYQ